MENQTIDPYDRAQAMAIIVGSLAMTLLAAIVFVADTGAASVAI